MAGNQRLKLAESKVPHGLTFEHLDDTNEPFNPSVPIGYTDLKEKIPNHSLTAKFLLGTTKYDPRDIILQAKYYRNIMDDLSIVPKKAFGQIMDKWMGEACSSVLEHYQVPASALESGKKHLCMWLLVIYTHVCTVISQANSEKHRKKWKSI